MARTVKKHSVQQRWAELGEAFRNLTPHLNSVLVAEDDFVGLRALAREDGTVLVVVKCIDASGGPIVCFGSGYGVAGALIAADATIQGGHWKVDKPWSSGTDGNE